MIPYFLFWIPIWFLFTDRGRQNLRFSTMDESKNRTMVGKVVTASLASVMLGGGTFLLILLFYLFAWGQSAAIWLGQHLLPLIAAMVVLSVPAVIKGVR